MYDEEGEAIEAAPHPQQKLYMKLEQLAGEDWLIRKKK